MGLPGGWEFSSSEFVLSVFLLDVKGIHFDPGYNGPWVSSCFFLLWIILGHLSFGAYYRRDTTWETLGAMQPVAVNIKTN